MSCKDIANRVKQRPFVPFHMVLTEGSSYEIRHPEQIMLARDYVTIGIPSESDDFYETTTLVDIFHVVKIEPIPVSPKESEAS